MINVCVWVFRVLWERGSGKTGLLYTFFFFLNINNKNYCKVFNKSVGEKWLLAVPNVNPVNF